MVDCLVGPSAPWVLVGTCTVVSHMAYREPSMHYFTCLHLFGIGEVASMELIDAQLIVLIELFDHEYLFFMYVVSARVWCASYIDFCSVL